jgi:hypothetical protein
MPYSATTFWSDSPGIEIRQTEIFASSYFFCIFYICNLYNVITDFVQYEHVYVHSVSLFIYSVLLS